MSDTYWLVRRIRRHDGGLMAKPTLWGKVLASSETVAVAKFLSTIRSGDNPTHFEAIPHGRRT